MANQPHVTIMIPCLIDAVYPQTGESLLRLFERLRISYTIATNHTCCGFPAYNSGYRTYATAAAKRFIEIFENSHIIVSPSGACVHMVRHHYLELFANDVRWKNRAYQISKKIYELTEFLVDVLGIHDTGSNFKGTVTWHDSCQSLRYLGIFHQPRKLLSAISGVELIEMKDSDRCCGFGGSFSVEYADISAAILEDKIAQIVQTGAEVVSSCDSSCLMNIQGMIDRKNLQIKTLHIVDILAGKAMW